MLENDFRFWKIHKIIKDQAEIDEVEQLFHKNIKELKHIYLTLISMSGFPNLTWLDFANYIKHCQIIDEKLPLSTIDRLFIVTNVEIEQIAENPDRALCRYEMWEILLRIAAQKYKD